MTQTRNPETGRKQTLPLADSDASPLEARFMWVSVVMFDVVYMEGNAHCVKGSQWGGPSWQRRTQTAHDTLGGWQSTIRFREIGLRSLRGGLMQTTYTRRRHPVGQWHLRRICAICLPLPCSCARDILAAARLTHTTQNPPDNDSNTAGNVDSRGAWK